jgi:hypothetical protein
MDAHKSKKIVLEKLNDIINSNIGEFKTSGSFKVRPGYGYDKFYLDRIEGSYDMSLQSLIHYILLEEGIYESQLGQERFAEVKRLREVCPEAIYSISADNEENTLDYVRIQENFLDVIYGEGIRFVGSRLKSLGFEVEAVFRDYL